jgi:hypothetical protein
LTIASRPQTIQQYFEACHALDLSAQVITDRSLTTQGETTNPVGRIFPRRIIPWNDFATRQEEIWDALSTSDSFFSNTAFPSQHQMEYVKSLLRPISSEIGLRDFERDVVENAVEKLIQAASTDATLQRQLDIRGTVTFESHTNLGTNEDTISEPMEQMSLSSNDGRSVVASTPNPRAAPKSRRKAKGKGNRADQFCIYRMSDGEKMPKLAIEYKAPHKLSVDEVVTGLESAIEPERDVINQDGEGFYYARRLAAAVVTQLFSYMIGKGIQYGYVCTGQAFVFLHISDDPSIVYYSVCIPKLDVMDEDETRLHRTAVAQVFAFILQALRSQPPPESWYDEADRLGTWAVEYDDILHSIPAEERRGKGKKARVSLYKPQRWKGFERSPIRTRSKASCQDTDLDKAHTDDEEPPSPSPDPRSSKSVLEPAAAKEAGNRVSRRGKARRQGSTQKQNIQDRPFCTQACLKGLAHGGPMDEHCPNVKSHGQDHIDRPSFLSLVRDQLARDRGRDADCVSMYRSGARGSLFKVRLTSHGYTLVAKGMQSAHQQFLRHENAMYDRLIRIQGTHIPVCIGNIELVRPWHYDGRVNSHFMFLSWAGRPLLDCPGGFGEAVVADKVAEIFKAMHKLRVLHSDAEPRNILCGEDGQLMAVDLERAKFHDRPPLSHLSPNNRTRKRKRGIIKQRRDEFAQELSEAVEKCCRVIRSSRIAIVPSEFLETHENMIPDTTSDLGSHMSEVQQKIDRPHPWNAPAVDEVALEGHSILEEEECTKRGLDMCDELPSWKVQNDSAFTEHAQVPNRPSAHKFVRRGLSQVGGSLQSPVTGLKSHEASIGSELGAMSLKEGLLKPLPAELARLQQTKESISQCIHIVSDAKDLADERSHIFEDITLADNSTASFISTGKDLIMARRCNLGDRSQQWVGSLEDDSVRRFIEALTQSDAEHPRLHSQTVQVRRRQESEYAGSRNTWPFDSRFGPGFSLQERNIDR